MTATARAGLTAAQVEAQRAAGNTNDYQDATSRSASEILRANVFTVFNAILCTALVIVLLVGNWRDALFGFVLILNTATGTLAEIRAKRALDALSVLAAPTACAIRDAEEREIPVADVVLGDLLRISTGQQVPADGVVVEDHNVEIDESILTGESVSVRKDPGENVLSGTTVVAGSALVQVEAVGAAAYAHRLAAQARKYSTVTSELQVGTNRVLKWISWVIVPMALLLLWSQIRVEGGWDAALASGQWKPALVLAVAGVVGMVPQGLVLLTSINFAAASLSLARKQVLVQELPAVEVLARVDVLCLDKTGTLTSGGVELREILPVGETETANSARAALAYLVGGEDANATGRAISEGLSDVVPAVAENSATFSSARKWSAVSVLESGTAASYVLGAPEIVLAASLQSADSAAVSVLEQVEQLASTGARVLVLARSEAPWGETADGDVTLPAGLQAVLLVVLGEAVRPDAAQTLEFFRQQGVSLRIISGDNPATVAAIAGSVGVTGTDGQPPIGIDARTLPSAQEDPEALAQALADGRVFGRVTPEQKRDFVAALQSRGHTVAMTGDGVNDALALKDADLGIAMGNAAPATKAVSRLILLDGKFSSLPGVLAQGRRVIANMERVASLFLAKTTYAALIAAVVAVTGIAYPYLPRQLTIVGSLTIGIPAAVIALAPTNQRYRPGFLGRVLRLAVPAGLVVGTGVLVARSVLLSQALPTAQVTTGATLVLVVGGLWLLSLTARPWVWRRALLVGLMAGFAVLGVFLPFTRDFFALSWPVTQTWMVVASVGAAVCMLVEAVGHWAATTSKE